MRDLTLVRVLPDGALLLADPQSPGAQFRLPLDGRLRAVLPAGPAPADQLQIQLSSSLTPREIQARFRAGQPAEDIARLAGVPVERVRRFEAPIRAERDRVAGQAQRAVVSDAADLYTGQPLGALVEEQLRGAAGRAAAGTALAWDAWRREDGRWVVEVTWGARGRGSAQWLWDPVRLRLTALSAAAEDFSRGRGGRPAAGRPPAPADGATAEGATAAAGPVAAGPVAAGSVRLEPASARVEPASARLEPATERPAAAAEQPASRRAAPAESIPVAGLGEPRPDGPPPTGSRATGGRRAAVPAWSDVLLGTSPRGGTPRDAGAEQPTR